MFITSNDFLHYSSNGLKWQIFWCTKGDKFLKRIWYCYDHLVRTSPPFHNFRRHIHTHTTHRPVLAEIQVVSSVLAVQQKKADGKVDSLSWTHGLGTHQTVGEPTENWEKNGIPVSVVHKYTDTHIYTHTPIPTSHTDAHMLHTHTDLRPTYWL